MGVERKTPTEAVDLLRYCLSEGAVIPGKHFREELAAEGLVLQDVWLVLKHGNIFDPPEEDIKSGEWKYRVEGYEPGGKWIAVVFCFKAIDRAFLITVFSVESRRRSR